MIALMPSIELTDQPADPLTDWPQLWRLLLQARQGLHKSQAEATQPELLRADAVHGWQLGGSWSVASRALFNIYKPLLDARLAQAGRIQHSPALTWALAQLGQSLDGCVATASGDSYFVTGPESLLHLHRLRALCDAVMVGAGTVAADNPQLTTRRVPGPQPVRVVLDPAARLDGSARVLCDGAAPSLWVCDSRHAAVARSRLQAPMATGVGQSAAEVLAVEDLLNADDPAKGFNPARVWAALAARGLRLLFVEGGGVTVSRCLAAGMLDRLHLVIAPVLIGNGRPGLQWPGATRMADCPRPPARRLALGEDMLWDLDLTADLKADLKAETFS